MIEGSAPRDPHSPLWSHRTWGLPQSSRVCKRRESQRKRQWQRCQWPICLSKFFLCPRPCQKGCHPGHPRPWDCVLATFSSLKLLLLLMYCARPALVPGKSGRSRQVGWVNKWVTRVKSLQSSVTSVNTCWSPIPFVALNGAWFCLGNILDSLTHSTSIPTLQSPGLETRFGIQVGSP